MVAHLETVPLFHALAERRRILIAGAGGGFDVLSGLPLYLRLRALGKKVELANLTFTYVGATDARPIYPGLYEVDASTAGDERYFPEKHLATWLETRGLATPIFLFEKSGLAPLREAWQALHRLLDFDAVVLVDGGTDILMHGDEAGLGTPVEDITSLLSVSSLDVPTKLVACVGFGVDAFHGVCHAHFLENVASLAKANAFLGTFSLLSGVPEVDAWLDAVAWVQERTPRKESIVCASIASAVKGCFGDHHVLERTRTAKTELFINPLMGIVWTFGLDEVARRCTYATAIESTRTVFEVGAAIEAQRKGKIVRGRRSLPM